MAQRSTSADRSARLAALVPDLRDVAVIVGLFALTRGVWLVYPPAAWMLAGIALVLLGLVGVPSWRS